MIQRVLVVEDDADVREALGQTLELADLDATLAGSFVACKDLLTPDFEGVVLSDIRMPGRDGLYLLDFAQGKDSELPVVLLTGEGDIPMAVDAISRGAFDFLEKPCPPDALLRVVTKALRARALVLENRRLKSQVSAGDAAAQMIFGVSRRIEETRAQVRLVARAAGCVLVSGPPGAGVTKVANVIHRLSATRAGPFETRSAACLDRSALSDAFRSAAEGILFLDEISMLPLDAQFWLVEHLEQRGAGRLIAGTSRPLADLAESGAFNADLYFQLDALTVRVPPLRERPEDIPVLFEHYVAQACEQAGLPAREIGAELTASLMARDWPGNARSLMNAAMRFALGLDIEDAPRDIGLSAQMAQIESALIGDALRRTAGNASEAAKLLRLPRKTFYDKLARHGIRAEAFR